jgi:hypothetical protein
MAVRRLLRKLVFSAAVLWILFLGGLALWTANPVTLNRDQIRVARLTGAVIVGQVVNTKTGQVKVEEILASAEKLPVEITVGREISTESLADAGLKDGEHAVLPLIILPAGELALAPSPMGTARAYPATIETVNAVKELLAAK